MQKRSISEIIALPTYPEKSPLAPSYLVIAHTRDSSLKRAEKPPLAPSYQVNARTRDSSLKKGKSIPSSAVHAPFVLLPDNGYLLKSYSIVHLAPPSAQLPNGKTLLVFVCALGVVVVVVALPSGKDSRRSLESRLGRELDDILLKLQFRVGVKLEACICDRNSGGRRDA